MTLTAGALTQQSVGSTTANLISTAASGGTGPYSQQWYRSTTTGFSPGGGNIITGATALTLHDTGLLPNTIYYYKVVYTDTGHSNDTVNSAQLVVTTVQQSQSPNQFQQSVIAGVLDLRLNYNTIGVQFDPNGSGVIIPGQAVKFSDSSLVGTIGGNTLPLVVPVTAITDEVAGFANYNLKDAHWGPGQVLEVSLAGNVMYMIATTAISRGVQVCIDPLTTCGVEPIVSTANYVGYTLDKAQAAGQNIRVMIATPSFIFAS